MIKTIIFDFDGTIIDTNALIEEGLNHFSLRYRGNVLSRKEITALTGKTLEDQMHYIHPLHAFSMLEQFKIWYTHHHNEKTRAFPGIINLIKNLKSQGYRLAIVSNNSIVSLNQGLKHLMLTDYFDMIITRDDVHEVKPSPEGLEKTLVFLETAPSEAIYIGDTHNDMLAAKRANIASVMVGWSQLDVREILLSEPDYVIASPLQLMTILDSINEDVISYEKMAV